MLGFALNYVAVHRTKRQMTPQDDFKFSKAVCVDRESAKSKATEKLSRKLKERVKLSYRSPDPFEEVDTVSTPELIRLYPPTRGVDLLSDSAAGSRAGHDSCSNYRSSPLPTPGQAKRESR